MAIDKLFPKKSSFRPMNRFEKSDPSLKGLYQKQKAQWDSEAEKAKKERDKYVKEMERLYGKDWARVLQQKKLEGQRATTKAGVEKAAEDMRSGKTSSFVGKGRDPYAGVEGPLPMYRTPEEAKAAGQDRYLLNERVQFAPGPAYVGKSPKESGKTRTAGEKPVATYKPTEGKGVEVRKAIPQQRVYKAMVAGKPDSSQVFNSQKEADKYLADEYNQRVGELQSSWKSAIDRGDTAAAKRLEGQIKGQRMGVVASVRGTPEEMERYKEESIAGLREQARLKDLYQQRRSEARGRTEKLQTAMQDYDEAESPELKATARARMEEVKREIDVAQKTRGMSEEQKKKFAEGLGGVLERRKTREQEWEKRTEKARGESRAYWADVAATEAAKKAIKDWQVQTSRLKNAYSKAVSKGDNIEAMRLYELLQEYLRFLPEDESERLEYVKSGAIETKKQQMAEEEERRRQALMRSNPDAQGY